MTPISVAAGREHESSARTMKEIKKNNKNGTFNEGRDVVPGNSPLFLYLGGHGG